MLDLNNRTIYPMGIQPALGNNYEVEEDDIGVYLQGDFRFEMGPHTLRGNLGVRYVETDTDLDRIHVHQRHASADRSDTQVRRRLAGPRTWCIDFSDTLLVRLGASQVMTRPEPWPVESWLNGECLR